MCCLHIFSWLVYSRCVSSIVTCGFYLEVEGELCWQLPARFQPSLEVYNLYTPCRWRKGKMLTEVQEVKLRGKKGCALQMHRLVKAHVCYSRSRQTRIVSLSSWVTWITHVCGVSGRGEDEGRAFSSTSMLNKVLLAHYNRGASQSYHLLLWTRRR